MEVILLEKIRQVGQHWRQSQGESGLWTQLFGSPGQGSICH